MNYIKIKSTSYVDCKKNGLGDNNLIGTTDGNVIQSANDTSFVLPPTKNYSVGTMIFWGQYASWTQPITIKQKSSNNLYVDTKIDVKTDYVLVFRLEQTSSTNKEWILFDMFKEKQIDFDFYIYRTPSSSSCPDCPQIKCPITPPCPSCPDCPQIKCPITPPCPSCPACPQTPSAAIYTTMFFVLVIFLSLIWIVKKLLQKS